ncbi:MAG: NADH-quinone oxidoreductase subunit J [Actinomycetota bacterium]
MGEVIVFVIFAAVALAGAVAMVTASNTVYSAVGLLTAMFSIAVLYVLLDAHLVAAVQVIVYAGAVMTLFLFVIMLIGVDRPDAYGPAVTGQRIMTAVVSVGLFAVIVLAGRAAWVTGSSGFGSADLNGTIEAVADELFGTWTIVFLSTVMLLTIAAVGTIALAYFGHGADDEEASL